MLQPDDPNHITIWTYKSRLSGLRIAIQEEASFLNLCHQSQYSQFSTQLLCHCKGIGETKASLTVHVQEMWFITVLKSCACEEGRENLVLYPIKLQKLP